MNKYVGLCCLLACLDLYAHPPLPAVVQTQTKIKQLDTQINNLHHILSTTHHKQSLLNKELSKTEKQMGEHVHKLHMIQNDIKTKEHHIALIQSQVNHLNQQIRSQQELLVKHMRVLYQMGEYQPLKWLLNQDEPHKINRILTYYQYIIKSRQQLITQIDETRKNLNDNEKTLHHELTETQRLKNTLSQQQQQLEHNKNYHRTLIQKLNHEIQKKQNTLQEAQKDKNHLQGLLKSLYQQSIAQSNKPFRQMRKKLPLPVQIQKQSILKMNQGVTFFAEEGTVVTAIYPGKVVFSDWLKGYGLLIIIDHGQGFMSLYAHNQSLFKSKGQKVHQQEQIASVGHSGGIKQNGLYFEIRLRGKAVPPLSWLESV